MNHIINEMNEHPWIIPAFHTQLSIITLRVAIIHKHFSTLSHEWTCMCRFANGSCLPCHQKLLSLKMNDFQTRCCICEHSHFTSTVPECHLETKLWYKQNGLNASRAEEMLTVRCAELKIHLRRRETKGDCFLMGTVGRLVPKKHYQLGRCGTHFIHHYISYNAKCVRKTTFNIST